MWQPRIPVKFTNAAGSAEFAFPLAEYSFSYDQGLRVPEARPSGAHGTFDLLGVGAAPKDPGNLRLSFTVFESNPETVEETVDEMLSKLWSYGRGWLYTSGLSGGVDSLRRTRARMVAMPSPSWQGGDVLSKAFTLGFRTDPFWYGTSTIHTATAVGSITVNNPGNAPIYNAVITIDGSYSDPVTVTNTTNGYRLRNTGTGTDIRWDASRPAVERWNGSSWVNDYSHFVRNEGQVHLMVLEPGDNAITVTGATGTIEFAAYPAWHF